MSAITAPGVVEDAYEDRVGPAPTLLEASLMPRVSTMPFEEGAVRDILAGAIGQPVDDTDLSVVVERDAGGAMKQRDWCRRGNTASLAAWLV